MADRPKSEIERFDEAFELILERGEFPTPALLYNEMVKTSSRSNAGTRKSDGMMLSGRCGRRRVELLQRHGFIKDPRSNRWIPGPRATISASRAPGRPSMLAELLLESAA